MEEKSCKQCWTMFTITDSDKDFLEKISPTFAGKKYPIPTPTFCPDCRQQRRLAFRNERKLYKRKCDLTDKEIISTCSPEKTYKVYEQNSWWSDQRNPMDYGKDFDSGQTFFQQFGELLHAVPHISVLNKWAWNSEYCHQSDNIKDCYLVFGAKDDQDCFYGNRITASSNVIDSSFVDNSKVIYQWIDVENSYSLFYSRKCANCSNWYYLYNCSGCHDCVACTDLNNQSYCIYNKQYSKEECQDQYKKIIEQIDSNVFDQFRLKLPNKASDIINSENAIWDNIYNSKNVYNSFVIYDSEDIKYSHDIYNKMNNCMDCYSWYGPLDNAYECHSFGVGAYNNYFINDCYPINDSFYCSHCYNSSNLFGCVGLRNQQYCILNKQYTREEYEKLVPQIIEHMTKTGERWEFFPSSLSPFGYNETVAQEYFPLTKEEALAKWFKRSDHEAPFPKTDSKDVIICEVSGKPFRLIPQEIEFYKKHNLPFPTKHPDVRHAERMKLRNPRKLRDRKCAKC